MIMISSPCTTEGLTLLQPAPVAPMEYTTLAGTDLRVSRICLGTMQFAGSSEGNALNAADITWGSVPQSEVNAAVEGALDAGINFFDTAEA